MKSIFENCQSNEKIDFLLNRCTNKAVDPTYPGNAANFPAISTSPSTTESPVDNATPQSSLSGELDGVPVEPALADSFTLLSLARGTPVPNELSTTSGRTSGETISHSIKQVSTEKPVSESASAPTETILLKEIQDIEKLLKKAQDSKNNISERFMTKGSRKKKELLEKAITCYDEALIQLHSGNQKLAQLHKNAGISSFNGACERIPLLIQQYEQIRDAYLGILEEEKKRPHQNDQVIKFFNSTINYSKLTVDKVKGDQPNEKNFCVLLGGTSSDFFKAAQWLQQGDHELSDAYFHSAISHCYLLVARNPKFIRYLSIQERASIREEPQSNLNLIEYWENALFRNDEKISALLAARNQQTLQNSQPTDHNTSGAI